MITRVLPANEAGLREAAKLISLGKLVAYPTDTLYGLGAHAFQPDAIAKVFAAKGRLPDRPLPLLIGAAGQMVTVAVAIPIAAWRLAAVFWPGALTIVLRRSTSVPDIVAAGGPTIGVRVPNHPIALSLLRAVGAPIAGTSANRSDGAPPATAAHVFDQLGGLIDAVVDGGACPVGVESTVLDLSDIQPRLIRAGAIAREELEEVLERRIE